MLALILTLSLASILLANPPNRIHNVAFGSRVRHLFDFQDVSFYRRGLLCSALEAYVGLQDNLPVGNEVSADDLLIAGYHLAAKTEPQKSPISGRRMLELKLAVRYKVIVEAPNKSGKYVTALVCRQAGWITLEDGTLKPLPTFNTTDDSPWRLVVAVSERWSTSHHNGQHSNEFPGIRQLQPLSHMTGQGDLDRECKLSFDKISMPVHCSRHVYERNFFVAAVEHLLQQPGGFTSIENRRKLLDIIKCPVPHTDACPLELDEHYAARLVQDLNEQSHDEQCVLAKCNEDQAGKVDTKELGRVYIIADMYKSRELLIDGTIEAAIARISQDEKLALQRIHWLRGKAEFAKTFVRTVIVYVIFVAVIGQMFQWLNVMSIQDRQQRAIRQLFWLLGFDQLSADKLAKYFWIVQCYARNSLLPLDLGIEQLDKYWSRKEKALMTQTSEKLVPNFIDLGQTRYGYKEYYGVSGGDID